MIADHKPINVLIMEDYLNCLKPAHIAFLRKVPVEVVHGIIDTCSTVRVPAIKNLLTPDPELRQDGGE